MPAWWCGGYASPLTDVSDGHPGTDTGASYAIRPLFDLLFRNYIHEFGFISKRRFKRECRPRPTEPEISFFMYGPHDSRGAPCPNAPFSQNG